MRISDQSKLLAACKEATATWLSYNDAPTVENFERRERAMSDLVRVLAAIERERVK